MMDILKLRFVFLLFIKVNYVTLMGENEFLSRLLPPVPTFADIAEKNGRTCEEYTVTTEDGYILKLFRIPGDPSRPILLMHGILDSADGYIARDNNSLALTLAEQNYDVWVGNNRGNRYSRQHVNLDPNTDKAFWNYTFHEMGYYDLPAKIDFILDKTGQKKLRAVGHSEGAAIFFVLGSTRPEYNDKVLVLACLAPIAYIHNARGALPLLIDIAPIINEIAIETNYEEVLAFNSTSHLFLRWFCNIPIVGYRLCSETLLFPVIGYDRPQIEAKFYPIINAHYPTGTSRVNLMHFVQIANRKTFAQYDCGTMNNLEKYGSQTPPNYDLRNVTMNVAMYLGNNDFISTITDVEILRRQLPNVVDYKIIEYQQWNHLDHTVGKDMPKYLFPHILDLLRKY